MSANARGLPSIKYEYRCVCGALTIRMKNVYFIKYNQNAQFEHIFMPAVNWFWWKQNLQWISRPWVTRYALEAYNLITDIFQLILLNKLIYK